MALKDRIRNDNTRIFMNKGQFAEEHTINGIPVICVMDDTLAQRIKLNNTQDRIIFITDTELNKVPDKLEPNQMIIFDRQQMIITSISDAIGMKEIHMTMYF